MASYEATVKWVRGKDEPFTDQHYSRRHHWLFDGGAGVLASSSPHSVKVPLSDPGAVDPEEALVAALSSCHMLFVLSFAARGGFAVRSYTDNAIGEMGRDQCGKEWIERVTLRPEIVFDGAKRPTEADVSETHRASHEACYIANSVKSGILIEGTAHGLV